MSYYGNRHSGSGGDYHERGREKHRREDQHQDSRYGRSRSREFYRNSDNDRARYSSGGGGRSEIPYQGSSSSSHYSGVGDGVSSSYAGRSRYANGGDHHGGGVRRDDYYGGSSSSRAYSGGSNAHSHRNHQSDDRGGSGSSNRDNYGSYGSRDDFYASDRSRDNVQSSRRSHSYDGGSRDRYGNAGATGGSTGQNYHSSRGDESANRHYGNQSASNGGKYGNAGHHGYNSTSVNDRPYSEFRSSGNDSNSNYGSNAVNGRSYGDSGSNGNVINSNYGSNPVNGRSYGNFGSSDNSNNVNNESNASHGRSYGDFGSNGNGNNSNFNSRGGSDIKSEHQNSFSGGRGGNGDFGNFHGGRFNGGRGRTGGRFNGGRGRGGGQSSAVAENPKSTLSNLILADVTTNFKYYLYGVDCASREGVQLDSRGRRQNLFKRGIEALLKSEGCTDKQIEDTKRVIFFEGSFFYSSREIPGLEKKDLPRFLVGNGETVMASSEEGDICRITNVQIYGKPEVLETHLNKEQGSKNMISVDFRCANCTMAFAHKDSLLNHCRSTGHAPVYEDEDKVPANVSQFLSFCNTALQRAMGERMARWGREYIDPNTFTEPTDKQGRSLGVKVFRAYTCEFGMCRHGGKQKQSLHLTVDLRAKVLRTKSLLDNIYEGRDPNNTYFDSIQIDRIKKQWCNEQVICTYDKRTYSVIDVLFDQSASSMPIPGSKMSHTEYFKEKKGIVLEFPNARPLLAVLGRNQSTIHLPAELVCGNELDSKLQCQLPIIASFKPIQRNDAIEEMKRYLKPGAQKTKRSGGGLLPALGIVLGEDRVTLAVDCLPLPTIIAAGVNIPSRKGKNWAPCLAQANFNVEPGKAVVLNTIVVYHKNLSRTYMQVYHRIAQLVNNFQSHYRFSAVPYATVEAGDIEAHWEAIEQFFAHNKIPENVFVLDFTQPPRRSSTDPAYSVVKQMLGKAGYLSQFINFNIADHGNPRNSRKSNTILSGTSRQILSKCGVRVWWVDIPKTVPLPAVFVGVDCFHAPRKYNPKEGRRTGKESCAAVVVQLIRKVNGADLPTVELYSVTERQDAGTEVDLSNVVERAVSEALDHFQVNPMSCIVWRDGVGDPGIQQVSETEIPAVRNALENFSLEDKSDVEIQSGDVPLAYIVCQKSISTKFLSADGTLGMPPGALIDDLHSANHDAFYINGTSPPYSTPKAVRFVIAMKDEKLQDVSISGLSWALCHDYPNWTGPIKVPSLVQMAHKLAELTGNYDDCGDSVNSKAFANKLHFL